MNMLDMNSDFGEMPYGHNLLRNIVLSLSTKPILLWLVMNGYH